MGCVRPERHWLGWWNGAAQELESEGGWLRSVNLPILVSFCYIIHVCDRTSFLVFKFHRRIICAISQVFLASICWRSRTLVGDQTRCFMANPMTLSLTIYSRTSAHTVHIAYMMYLPFYSCFWELRSRGYRSIHHDMHVFALALLMKSLRFLIGWGLSNIRVYGRRRTRRPCYTLSCNAIP